MSDWPTTTLGELCEVEGGNAAPQDSSSYVNGNVPFVRMKDLGRYHHTNNLETTNDKLTEEAIADHRMKTFEPGCILFPRSGSVFLNHRAILGIRACIVSHIGILHSFSENIYPAFLYRYLMTYDMKRLSKKTTGVDSIGFSDVKNIKVPVPSLAEQVHIVRLLDEAEEVRRLRAEADRRTADLIPALFHDLFGDPLRNPKGWEVAKVDQIATKIQYGFTESASPVPVGPKFLRITDVQDGQVNWDHVPYCRCLDMDEYKLKKGDIVFARTGATTGKSFLISDCPISVFASYLIRVQLQENVSPVYVYHFFQTEAYWSQIKLGITGSTQGGFNATKLRNIKLPVPPLADQLKFVAYVEKIEDLRAKQGKSEKELYDLFQSLLHRAFRGEL